MAQPAPTFPLDPTSETPDARDVRLVWESARLAEAEEDFAAGRYIEGDEAEAWLQQELADAQALIDREPD